MALSDLVNDPYSVKRYLAEIGAYDITGTATTTVRVSDHGLVTLCAATNRHQITVWRIQGRGHHARHY